MVNAIYTLQIGGIWYREEGERLRGCKQLVGIRKIELLRMEMSEQLQGLPASKASFQCNGEDQLPFGHLKIRQCPIQEAVEGFHFGKDTHGKGCKVFLYNLPVRHWVFQIPALVFEILCLRMVRVIPLRHLFQRRTAHGEAFRESRFRYNPLPFLAAGGDRVPNHPGGVFELVRKQPASQKGLAAGFYPNVVADRDGQLAFWPDMCPKGRVIGRFVMAEPGYPVPV